VNVRLCDVQLSTRWREWGRHQKRSPHSDLSEQKVCPPPFLLLRTLLDLTNKYFPRATESDNDEDEDEDDDDDDDIAMPAGPPPGAASADGRAKQDNAESDDDSSDSDEDDEDDIPLPPGPPPPRPDQPSTLSAGPARHTVAIARPSGFPPHSLPPRPNFQPPPPPPLPPAGRPPHHGPKNPRLPARPPPAGSHMFDPLNTDGGPNRAYQQGGQGRGSFGPVLPQGGMPPPPPPLPPAPSGPSPFFAVPGAQPAAVASATLSYAHPIASAGATISAAPQLRDLKKEATAFVPLAMRKKMKQQRATLAKAGLSSINAARGAVNDDGSGGGGGEVDGGEEGGGAPQRKRTLMDEMRERGIGASGAAARGPSQAGGNASSKDDAQVDDYERFREEMADLL
jgi:hypothetical protein